jgi:GNAT superfamily N-acetyltransferase
MDNGSSTNGRVEARHAGSSLSSSSGGSASATVDGVASAASPASVAASLTALSHEEVATRAREGRLPQRWRMRIKDAPIFTLGAEDLVLRQRAPVAGDAVCLISGGRTTFRRVLAIEDAAPRPRLRLRGDVAPFEDAWDTDTDGEVIGCVDPRIFDQFVMLDPVAITRSNWYAAMAAAHALSAKKRITRSFGKKVEARFRTRILSLEDWAGVRAFWLEACGDPLPVQAHEDQHVVGLFDENGVLRGATIHLRFGTASYSAFTLVDRRFRNQGGGRAMIEHAVKHARTRGLTLCYVHIHVRNIPSILAYKRVGFHAVRWWRDDSDPLLAAERQWKVFELTL